MNNSKQILLAATSVALVATLVKASCSNKDSKTRQHDATSDDFTTSVEDIPSELLKSNYAKELKLAVKMAIQAGTNMVDYCETRGIVTTEDEANSKSLSLEITTKKGGPVDFCTQVDLENEQLVMKGIREEFPSHLLIGEEESSSSGLPPLTEAPTWVIDPIDGTTNFASGLPLTCVSIGFCDKKRPVLGVIYAPLTKEMYMAVKDYGAYRNGQRIVNRMEMSIKPKLKLEDSIVGFEFGYARNEEEIGKMVGAVQGILKNGCRAMRQLGSGCLDLCYVATGRLDVVYSGVSTEGWNPWDYCAGLVICEEAGCVMESLFPQKTKEFDLYSKSVLCAVSQELLEECRMVVLENI